MDSFTHHSLITLTHGDDLIKVVAQLQPSSNKILVVRNNNTLLIFNREGPHPQLFYERSEMGVNTEYYHFTDRDNNRYCVFGAAQAQALHPKPLQPVELVRVTVQDNGAFFVFVSPNYNNEVRKRSPPRCL